MKIVLLEKYYSEKMGYSSFYLCRALAARGHDVHMISSQYQLQEAFYNGNYEEFLGPRELPTGTKSVENFTLHRLELGHFFGHEYLRCLPAKLKELNPDIVISVEATKLDNFIVIWAGLFLPFRFFVEDHTHLSVFPPGRDGMTLLQRVKFFLFRNISARILNRKIEKWYPIAPDSAEIMIRFFALDPARMILSPLVSDSEAYHPAESADELARRTALRTEFGVGDDEILCVYSGRFTVEKNPLCLAEAVDELNRRGKPYKALFIGSGSEQEKAISGCRGCLVKGFVRHTELPDLYRAADIGVWPQQESTSQLDAMATGLPIVISDRVQTKERFEGNGLRYHEPDSASLAEALLQLESKDVRQKLGAVGRERVAKTLSWSYIAELRERDFNISLRPKQC